MFHKLIARLNIPLLMILFFNVLLLLAVFLSAGGAGRAQAHSDAAVQPSAPSSANSGLTNCTIAEVSVLEDRIHVHCTTVTVVGVDNVYYFAYATDSAHAANANRFLTILNTAYALNKPVAVGYDNNYSNNPANCSMTDCRKIMWLTTVP